MTYARVRDMPMTYARVRDMRVTYARVRDMPMTYARVRDMYVTYARVRDMYVTYHEEWAHATRKAEGSHDLRAGGPTICELEAQGSLWCAAAGQAPKPGYREHQ